jgi:hypothetical protein
MNTNPISKRARQMVNTARAQMGAQNGPAVAPVAAPRNIDPRQNAEQHRAGFNSRRMRNALEDQNRSVRRLNDPAIQNREQENVDSNHRTNGDNIDECLDETHECLDETQYNHAVIITQDPTSSDDSSDSSLISAELQEFRKKLKASIRGDSQVSSAENRSSNGGFPGNGPASGSLDMSPVNLYNERCTTPNNLVPVMPQNYCLHTAPQPARRVPHILIPNGASGRSGYTTPPPKTEQERLLDGPPKLRRQLLRNDHTNRILGIRPQFSFLQPPINPHKDPRVKIQKNNQEVNPDVKAEEFNPGKVKIEGGLNGCKADQNQKKRKGPDDDEHNGDPTGGYSTKYTPVKIEQAV